jgi:hypothetical protein
MLDALLSLLAVAGECSLLAKSFGVRSLARLHHKPHWTKVLFATLCTAGKIIFDYVIRRPNALSAG